MKRFLPFLAIVLIAGCVAGQKAAYNTLYTIQKAVQSADDAYLDGVVHGIIPSNNVPSVSRKYNHFQAGYLIALDAVQFNTNALAPAALVIESADFVAFVTSVTPKH